MNSTVLRFDGGAIPTGGGASSDRAIHHLFLRELTITELGQEVSVYALLDLDRPTLAAPNYEPVSAFTLFDWCSRGDVLQVDVAEALETGTNTYSAFFESANVATNSDGSYVDECVIRVDTKLSSTTPKINTRYLHLSQILDESTSIAYMCQHTSLNDHVTYGDELRRTGKVHFLKAVYDSLAQESAPYGYWIVDLEKPNPQSPYGYDYAMADEIIAKLSAGEIFVLSTYPTAPSPEEDLYIMCSSALQSREGHTAVRIWFTRMFAADSPEYMYFTTIYTPSMSNSEGSENNYPEGRMAILNWRGQQDSRSEFRFMEYTELATVATTGSYEDLSNKPDIPELVQSDWDEASPLSMAYIQNKPNLSLKEDISNKAATLLDTTSKTQYPSSKAVADFVNSSVATNTANFLGTLSESSLGLDYTATNAQIALALNVHSWDSPPTNNDYCFVSVNDPQTTDVDEYRRFKFNGSVWAYEYTLNNSSFTQAQWNAINSGIDSSDKAAYDAAITLLSNHVNDHSNPHNVTAAQIGAEPAFTVLPINKGGTGKTTALDAAENLINNLRAGNAQILNDNCVIITSSLNEESPLRFFKRSVVTIWNYIKDKLVGATVNVHQSDSNTDTSSFVFVNGHVYHLTVSLIGSGFSINTPNSGMGTVVAYIGRTSYDYHYISIQNVGINQGILTTDDIRLPVDWKAENIAGSSDNKLHIKVIFNNIAYPLVQSNYELTIDGTDFSGV